MATTTENLYVGDGSTVLYSFTFPYIDASDIYVSVDDVDLTRTTEYIFANATTVQILVAPIAGAAIRIYRATSNDDLRAVFFPGSAIRASDLNDNFTQSLYVVQEATFSADASTDAAEAARISAEASAASAATAASSASDAQSTASDALSNSQTALSTASTAETKSDAAIATSVAAGIEAEAAELKAEQALSAVLDVVPFEIVANVAAIPASPEDNEKVQVNDSAGIESFTPLSSLPAGFIGDAGLYVVISYSSAAATWIYDSYNANNPDDRYSAALNALSKDGGTITGDLFVDGALVSKGGSGGSGEITLNCENNSHGVKIKGPAHSAGATYTITLPDDTGTTGQVLSTDGVGNTSWSTVVTDIDLDSYPALPSS